MPPPYCLIQLASDGGCLFIHQRDVEKIGAFSLTDEEGYAEAIGIVVVHEGFG